jgi:NAD(P)-dependent dehydrogenase (short-subunit alcohol dehydrogenase family)
MAKCLSVEWVDFCRVNCISPGFIATEILDIHPEEWRAKWYDMIPAKRMAQAYELKGVSGRRSKRSGLRLINRISRPMYSVLRTLPAI